MSIFLLIPFRFRSFDVLLSSLLFVAMASSCIMVFSALLRLFQIIFVVATFFTLYVMTGMIIAVYRFFSSLQCHLCFFINGNIALDTLCAVCIRYFAASLGLSWLIIYVPRYFILFVVVPCTSYPLPDCLAGWFSCHGISFRVV